MKRNIKKLWAKYDKIFMLSEDLQKIKRQEILDELDKFSEDEKEEEFFYLKGFICYMNQPSEISKAQNYFQKTLELNLVHAHARLHLGHCLYDLGLYEEAEYHFSLVDKDDFNAQIRDLMQMKIEEMIVCCHIKLSNLDEKSFSEAKAIIYKYCNLQYLDDYLFNLHHALKEFGINLDELAIENLKFRQATREDLPEIVRLLADDFLGAQRERFETPLPESYVRAFEEIAADKNNELVVAEAGGETVGTLQITFTPSISFQGGKRATIEAVRVDEKYRGRGVGKRLILWAIERAKIENCFVLQLTTNSERKDAHRFYENLGFKGSHLGMKLYLK